MADPKPIIGRGDRADVRLTVENATDVKIEVDLNRDGRFDDLVISATQKGDGVTIVTKPGYESEVDFPSSFGQVLAGKGITYAPNGLSLKEANDLILMAESAAVSLKPVRSR